MLECDVAIVGGGPVGGYIAGRISKEKFTVSLFERNKEIGVPLNCAGLISPRVFDFLDMSKESVVQNAVKGAHIHSPSGKVLTVGGDRVHALAIDRSKFDEEIIKKSESNGAKIFLKNNVISAKKIGERIELKTSQNLDVKCKLLIGADGPYSKIRDGFAFPKPHEFLKGIGAEIKDTNLDPDFVEIFVGKNVAPGFFAWIIPTNKKGTNARIGLCIDQESTQSPKYYFSNFFKNKYSSPFLENAEITKSIGGFIPLGVLKRTYDSNVMLVGDAAAQVKPTSGGGIYSGILCANHCSNVAIDSLKKNNFSSQFLKKYHKSWFSDIGRELNLGMKFRRIFKGLSDRQFDKYIEKFSDTKIAEIISKYGDIDHPSKLVKPLLKNTPSLLKLVPYLIKEK